MWLAKINPFYEKLLLAFSFFFFSEIPAKIKNPREIFQNLDS